MKLYMFRAVPVPIIRSLFTVHSAMVRPGVAQWLRHCATSRAVPESNPGGVGHRDFSRGFRQNHVPWGQLSLYKMSTRDSPGGKGGRCVRLTSYHPCSAERQEIRGLNLPGTPWDISTACCWRDLYPLPYTQQWYVSYSFRAGPGRNCICSSILVLLESCLQTCMTYTIVKCTVNKLLMMDRGTARNM